MSRLEWGLLRKLEDNIERSQRNSSVIGDALEIAVAALDEIEGRKVAVLWCSHRAMAATAKSKIQLCLSRVRLRSVPRKTKKVFRLEGRIDGFEVCHDFDDELEAQRRSRSYPNLTLSTLIVEEGD